MLLIGHRGAPMYEPENTIRSFKKAMEIGANAIEFDVRKTRDEQLVVIHDADVKRTTNKAGAVSELTFAEIKGLSTQKGERIPTLEETLSFIGDRVKMLIELKDKGYEGRLLSLIRQRELQQSVILISFLEETLRRIREIDPGVEVGLIYARHKNPIQVALELKANYLLPLYRFTHSANVQQAHKNGLKVIVWTINTREEAVEYAAKGVDGIASDKPDILVGLD